MRTTSPRTPHRSESANLLPCLDEIASRRRALETLSELIRVYGASEDAQPSTMGEAAGLMQDELEGLKTSLRDLERFTTGRKV